ncbi:MULTISPECIES: hypothetical protein [unclassified Serratia (in: enterobacteria)]|uniref:hypothetical protein n=1 Tax=unclassified Serratia (in: enterobacteria) TaxID=2647522 RepID=UPI000507EE6A|nr:MULTISPECIES: hypothetical protein [unclassified Serratia (in: enterobacteria)]KFK94575.1 hypothetical protein JV45_11695 [Serratia sp. Ag2]KFK95795.1 hypothetical protein IV04_20465 [Serratia sp. Ag1]
MIDLDDALDFDLFQGDFGEPGDSELSNSIVKGRKEHSCFICSGGILKGENHRRAVWKFSGELHTYRCCNACCVAMIASINCDYDDDDPIDARYAIGDQH